MSKYTTGEVARLCGVTVRTVQYYDSRGILVPTELSEGGRRLYSDDDLKRMRIICFLRGLGLPIDAISQLLSEKDPGSVISLLLEQQEKTLQQEIGERHEKLEKLLLLKQELKAVKHFSVESIGIIAYSIANKEKLKKVRKTMLISGLPISIAQWVSIILWITRGFWWLFVLWIVIAACYAIWISRYYFHHVAYICPQCHTVFKPALRDAFWAKHTPSARKLTCTACGHHGFCVETYGKEESSIG
ncbi:MAG: MerR family transcriptional regulator [Clostridiales bacterium]|nr:MerR family transcriptional regulator [Clostridiales bacterium]